MKTAPEFIESISKQKKELFILGEKVDNPAQQPVLCPSLRALEKTYELAHDNRDKDVFLRQGADGNLVNCFTSLHHSKQYLLPVTVYPRHHRIMLVDIQSDIATMA